MGFRLVELGDVITNIATGPFGSNLKVSCFTPSGFPVVDGANLKGYKLTDNITKYVSEEKAASLSRSIAHRGDVVATISGNVGQVSYIPHDSAYPAYLCSQRQFKVTFDTSRVYVPYLVYYLHTREGQHQILSFVNQTGVPALAQPTRNFKRIVAPLPSLEEQIAIARIPELLDRLIELNNQLNGYLTQLALCLYEDFRNRADGANGTLGDLVSLQKNTIKAGQRDDLPYMPIDVIPMKSIAITELRPNEEAKSSLQTFNIDDIVVGAMRVYFHRVVLAPCEGITRNTCFVLRPHNESMREYALLTCFQESAIEYANVRSKGSTMPYAVWKDSFDTYPVLIPSEQALNKFSKQVAPIINRIRDSYFENKKLMDLRDALLPKLMSGEIDVSKVEVPTPPNSHLSGR